MTNNKVATILVRLLKRGLNQRAGKPKGPISAITKPTYKRLLSTVSMVLAGLDGSRLATVVPGPVDSIWPTVCTSIDAVL